VPPLDRIAVVVAFLDSRHEIGHGGSDALDEIERYGENCDLETGSNFRFL
jgi:hypothetical protein